jgi:hypothetical protein
LRADPTAIITYEGKQMTMENWMMDQRAQRTSVNGSY